MNHLKLYILLVFIMFAWGMNVPAMKYLTAEMGPVTMTSLRIFLAGVTVFAILAAFKLIRWPTRAEWPYVAAAALLNVVVHHYLIAVGISLTSGTNSGLIIGTSPIMTAVFSLLLLKLSPTKWQWLGFILGFTGVAATVLAGNAETSSGSIGDLYILLAIVAQVMSFMIISKASKTLDPRLLTAYMFIFGSFGIFLISLFLEPGEWRRFAEMEPLFWSILIGSGIIATALGHMLYNHALGQVGPPKAAIFINLNTFFALLGSAWFLGETITLYHMLGFVVIVLGVLLGSGAAEELWRKRIQEAKR
ncbi:DMT family transporter [Planococcus chinensis]|uniref:DMT family transporter n=1 Tax=Planococcus chinensis TaxID=272917 RepID=A0ABW4QCJ2_9BACL